VFEVLRISRVLVAFSFATLYISGMLELFTS
jgi:hypothetical protein